MGGKDLLKYSDGCKDHEEIDSIKPTNVCNQEKNALNRVRGSNTNLSKNYYQTSQQYRHSRCNTIQQKGYQYSNSGNGEYVSNCSNEDVTKSFINLVTHSLQLKEACLVVHERLV